MSSGLSLCSMDSIGIIASVVAAVGTVLSLWYSRRMSKGSIRKRIAKKQRQISDIDNELVRRYGINRGHCHPITSLDQKKAKLIQEIVNLQNEL